MNSGQSQKLAVGSTVKQYTMAAIRKALHPKTLSINLNFFIIVNAKCFAKIKLDAKIQKR